jgi:hypothetical protein
MVLNLAKLLRIRLLYIVLNQDHLRPAAGYLIFSGRRISKSTWIFLLCVQFPAVISG